MLTKIKGTYENGRVILNETPKTDHKVNVIVTFLEEDFIQTLPSVAFYRRYIDDLFIIWTGTLDEWNDCSIAINRLDDQLNIIFTAPSLNVVFLDIRITYNQFTNSISTGIYQKALNKYLYITPKSAHAPHTFSGFIKGELTRYARLSTSPLSYSITKQLLFNRLVARGYKITYLNTIFDNHSWISRTFPRRPDRKILPFILPYSYRNNQTALKRHYYDYSSRMLQYTTHTQSLFVYSATRNSRSYLCSSNYTPEQLLLLDPQI